MARADAGSRLVREGTGTCEPVSKYTEALMLWREGRGSVAKEEELTWALRGLEERVELGSGETGARVWVRACRKSRRKEDS